MLEALTDSTRRVSLVYAVCVGVQNGASNLGTVAFRFDLLARNGVVRAAKLQGGEGQALTALTEFLASLPEGIDRVVGALESASQQLARQIAECTNHIRVYQLLAHALLIVAKRELPGDPELEAIARLRFCDESDLQRLLGLLRRKDIPNLKTAADRTRGALVEVTRRLREARRASGEIAGALGELNLVARTSRYLASCLRIEIAHIADRRDLESFAAEVTSTLDAMEERLRFLGQTVARGESLLATLSTEVSSHAQ